jgi:uncharacterized protein (TIGR03435 family)
MGKWMAPRGFCLRTLLLGTSLLCGFGQSPRAPVEFEVAAVHKSPMPSTFSAPRLGVTDSRLEIRDYALIQWIGYAFDVPEVQVSGPEWISRERYDLSAKLPPGSNKRDAPAMLQALLAERFGLRIHREPRQVRGFALVVGEGGAHVTPSRTVSIGSEAELSGEPHPKADRLEILWKNCTLSRFAQLLSKNYRVPVLNATNLAGSYDIPFVFLPQDLLRNGMDAVDNGLGPSVIDSVDRLGLKLERRGVTLETIVVDNVSKPAAN